MDKQLIYRKIMESVSKEVKKALNESNGWNPSFPLHKKTYNSFIKWYDKQLMHMDKYELLDMLKYICSEIESDSLDSINEGECCYNTGANTIGMGEVIPAGINTLGSGDRFDMPAANMATKKEKRKKK